MKAVYHKRANLLLWDTGKYNSSPVAGMEFEKIKSKQFKNETEAKKYTQRYLRKHEFICELF